MIGPWGWEAGEEGGAGGLTCGGIEGAVAVWKDGDDGGWELRWEDDDVEGKGVEGAMRVSLERRWIDAEEEEEEEEKEESEDVTEGKECGMGEGTKKKTETTFELRQKTVPRKSKKKSKAIAMTSNSVTQPVQK